MHVPGRHASRRTDRRRFRVLIIQSQLLQQFLFVLSGALQLLEQWVGGMVEETQTLLIFCWLRLHEWGFGAKCRGIQIILNNERPLTLLLSSRRPRCETLVMFTSIAARINDDEKSSRLAPVQTEVSDICHTDVVGLMSRLNTRNKSKRSSSWDALEGGCLTMNNPLSRRAGGT